MAKHNKRASVDELARILCLDSDTVKKAMAELESAGLVYRMNDNIEVIDLKEREIRKLYRPKTTSSPEEALANNEKNKRRNDIITAINHTFFQGLMPPSWYTNIDAWFERYKFDEDVMLALFHHCSSHGGLHPNYITKVAQNWYNKKIKTSFDLDRYSMEYQKYKDVKAKIIKKLKLSRNLTEYEEEIAEKWVMDYKYDFNIIELALKKTVSKTNPNFKYLDAIITDWYNNGLRTKDDIILYDKAAKNPDKKSAADAAVHKNVPQSGNYEQRKYDDSELDQLYSNLK